VDDIVKEFLIESNENLDRLDRNLVELEKSPRDQELLADIFRTIHSIKGTTGFLGFHHLESVAHAGENLLSRLRDGLMILNPTITSGLLAMVDAIREMLALIAAFVRPQIGEGAQIAISQDETAELAAAIAKISERVTALQNSIQAPSARAARAGSGGTRP